MSNNPEKDFGPIAEDYAFFETHATEAEQDARAYVVSLAGLVPAEGVIRLLDFGCGSGSFTARFPAALADGIAEGFDVVLANHVFYYVPELRSQLARLIDSLTSSGVLVTAIAPRTNALIQIWIAGFRLLGCEIPYNTSEDVESALQVLGAEYQKRKVAYELTFPDTEENRMRILRFLLADHLAKMPHRPLLEWFDRFSSAGAINIRTASDHFTIRAG
jgi:trans-aconitate 2-methyltransferase